MRTLAQHQFTLNLFAATGLLVLASAMPARAADQTLAMVAKPHASTQGVASMTDAVRVNHSPNINAVKPAAKAAAAATLPMGKASRQVDYERDLWRHQGVG